MLFHTLHHLLAPSQAVCPLLPHLDEVVIAARPEEWPAIQAVVDLVDSALRAEGHPTPAFRIVAGGTSRQDSVLAAVSACSGDYVAVHDAARPFADRALLEKVWSAAQTSGAAIAALPASDTVKRAAPHDTNQATAWVESTLERAAIWLVQTPQVFLRSILQEALELATREAWAGTDCAGAVERLVDDNGNRWVQIALVPGDALNFKVTFAPDLARAEWELKNRAR